MTMLLFALGSVALASSTTSSGCDANDSPDLGPGVASHSQSTAGGYLWPYYVYKSSPITPPVMVVNRTSVEPLAPGLIFLTPSDITVIKTIKRPAPYIYTDAGELVYGGPEAEATDFKWQELNDQPTLTYWSGNETTGGNRGHGYGSITFLDNTYQAINVLCPRLGLNAAGDGPFDCDADIHESHITARNTILISAYNATPADLRSVNGSAEGWAFDSQFYELDSKSGNVLFRWSSIEHVPINDSHLPLGTAGNQTSPYDYFHINSVIDVGDHYLVNSRHCWTVYLVDKSGKIVWEFAGDTGGDFGPLPENGHFSWQHFARPHNVTNTTMDISMFSNNNFSPFQAQKPTYLLDYTLPLRPQEDATQSQAILRSRFETKETLSSDSQGSYFPHLSNGNHWADYGQLAIMEEFDDAGEVIWSARFAPDNRGQSYRGFKKEWNATPYNKPDLALESTANGTFGYVSWNGATDVEHWNVYVGKTNETLGYVGAVEYRGFETRFDLPCWANAVQIGACEGDAEVRRSEVAYL